MPRLAEAPPPGVVRQATPDAVPGRWYDLNNMRWRGNVLQPVGGNQMMPGSNVTTGPPLDVITWHDNFFVRWAAFGTASHLYAYDFETSTVYDITPTGIGTIGGPSTRYGYGMGAYGAELQWP